jgi:hypothetical protein
MMSACDSITRRKGNKVIVLYEIEMAIKWEVTLKNSAGETIATSKVTYLNTAYLIPINNIDVKGDVCKRAPHA